MTDRPILFSGPMVRAILEGRKTQTRRFLAPACDANNMPFVSVHHGLWKRGKNGIKVFIDRGDRLWVRETWKPHSSWSTTRPSEIPKSHIFFGADQKYAPSNTQWRPSISMPRWASRITLIVESASCEQLQDITDSDAHAEGFKNVGAFADYWNGLTKTHRWYKNPWVSVVEFKSVFENIDTIGTRIEAMEQTTRGAG